MRATTMRAFTLTGHGDMSKLVYRADYPRPRPRANEVLIRVAACGLNNTDVNTRVGWYSKAVTGGTDAAVAPAADGGWGGALKFPRIQGADVCGYVAAAGSDVPADLIGQRVLVDPWLRDWDDPHNLAKCGYFGSECDGGFAEFTCVDYRQVHPITADLSDAELATFATAYVTAEQMLARAMVTGADTVLISGASGGVGAALVQLANRRGATTVALAAEPKHAQLRAIHPDAILPRAPADLRGALRNTVGAAEVSVAADVVGGGMWPEFIGALQRGGRYVVAGAIAGPMVELDLRELYLRNLTFFGAAVTPPDLFAELIKYIERGEIRPLLAATFPLQELPAAQQMFIAKQQVGNIVVQP